MNRALQRWIEICMGVIFPSRDQVSKIEALSPREFAIRATRVVDELPKSIYSLFKYKDPLVRQALWALKYEGNRKIGRLFAILLYDTLIEIISEATLYDNFSQPLFIPIPLSKERYKERGWNQAEIIVQEIIKLYPQSDWQYEKNILQKVKHTMPQTKLSRAKRLENLKNCFATNPEKLKIIKNRNIVLVDDVVTTGSTIQEARRTLLEAGARQVLAFTVAH